MTDLPPLSEGLVPRRGSRPFVHGEGCRLVDADGRSYLDLTSGHGVAGLGHAHPAVTRAIADQAERLLVMMPAGALSAQSLRTLLAILDGPSPSDSL